MMHRPPAWQGACRRRRLGPMRDIADDLRSWLDAELPLSLATIVTVHGSAPRPAGTAMAVNAAGQVAGSVSGGCVEADVAVVCQSVLDGAPARLISYGITDEDAFAVGMTCGGVIDVVVSAVDATGRDVLRTALERLSSGSPVAVVTAVEGAAAPGALAAVTPDAQAGTLGDEGLDARLVADARGMLALGENGCVQYRIASEGGPQTATVFVESFAPPPRMIVFGATDFAAAAARMGRFLGYRVTVCDARAALATAHRLPDAHEIVVEWPHRYLERTAIDARTVLCVLTHDRKFDVPLLQAALRTPAAYIGALGSRQTHAARLADLRARGVDEESLARLHAPIGLDLGARTPAETAVSIAAEIIASRANATGRPLAELDGRIHGERVRV